MSLDDFIQALQSIANFIFSLFTPVINVIMSNPILYVPFLISIVSAVIYLAVYVATIGRNKSDD